MHILLDTHTLLWYRSADAARLSSAARAAIDDPENEKYLSAATAWEVATKLALGKLRNAGVLGVDFTRAIVDAGYQRLAITMEHAQVAGALPLHHRDPFDRILIAQSLADRMPLVSNEALFDRYGVRRIW